MDTDMGTKTITYNCLFGLSHIDHISHALQGQSVEEKGNSRYTQVRDIRNILDLCRPDTQGTADYYQYHNNGQCTEGTGVPDWTLPPGAVYIPVLYFYSYNIHFVGKGSFLRVVMPLWRHA
jgi:hypothetical protein